MDPVSQSFIPKRPIEAERGGSVGLFFLIALLLFVISVVAAGAVFVYTGYLSTSIDNKKTSLVRSEDAYDLPSIQALVRIDSRLTQAKLLLAKHVAPSSIFDLLSQLTLAKVQLTSFSYALSANGAQITVGGVGDSFSTVALQSDQFGTSRQLHDVVFSGVSVNQDGVPFTVTANVDSSLIAYAKNLQSAPALQNPGPQTQAPVVPASSTASSTTPQTKP